MANKCALKKLLQMIANASSAIAEEGAVKMSGKLDEIRAKLKTVTRNNQTLMHDFERLFDQRLAIDEPVYEIVSLVDIDAPTPVTVNGRVAELVDLTEPFALVAASSSSTNVQTTASGRTRANRVVKSATTTTTTAPFFGINGGIVMSGVGGNGGNGGGPGGGNNAGGSATGLSVSAGNLTSIPTNNVNKKDSARSSTKKS